MQVNIFVTAYYVAVPHKDVGYSQQLGVCQEKGQ